MFPFSSQQAGSSSLAMFIGLTTAQNTSLALPAGSQPGDIAILAQASTSSAAIPAGWNTLQANVASGAGGFVSMCWKLLTSTDITAGSITSGAGAAPQLSMIVFRGPSRATIQTGFSGVAHAGSATFTGFVLNVGLVALCAMCLQSAGTLTMSISDSIPGWISPAGAAQVFGGAFAYMLSNQYANNFGNTIIVAGNAGDGAWGMILLS